MRERGRRLRRRSVAPGYVFAALEEIARRAAGSHLAELEAQMTETFDPALSMQIDGELATQERARRQRLLAESDELLP